MKRLHFGRPISIYGSELDLKLIGIIEREFRDWEVEDPNQKCHQDGYQEWKRNMGRGMDYFFQGVLPKCDGGIFLPFRDGKWGAGVFGECEFLRKDAKPVWEITHNGVISLVIFWEAVKKRVLSVEETRARVYGADGKVLVY